MLAFNKAAKALLAVRGELPVNLKFIIEGEEEQTVDRTRVGRGGVDRRGLLFTLHDGTLLRA